MQYFTQDDNFEMMYLTEDQDVIHAIEALNLPWEEHAKVMEAKILAYRSGHRLTLTRHTHVTEVFTPKYKRDTPGEFNYDKVVGKFFNDYLNNYVERLDAKYDKLITGVRKLLKVTSDKCTSRKLLEVNGNNDNKYHLTCLDITRQKKKWRKNEFQMTLVYFEFINQPKNIPVIPTTDDCPCDPCVCEPVGAVGAVGVVGVVGAKVCCEPEKCNNESSSAPEPPLPPIETTKADAVVLTEKDL